VIRKRDAAADHVHRRRAGQIEQVLQAGPGPVEVGAATDVAVHGVREADALDVVVRRLRRHG
jgi:hypothetical protein